MVFALSRSESRNFEFLCGMVQLNFKFLTYFWSKKIIFYWYAWSVLLMCNLLALALKQPLDKNVKIWDIWNGYFLLLVFNIIIKCPRPLRGVQMFPVWISKPVIWHTEEEDMFLSVYYCWVCFDNLGLVDFVFWLVICFLASDTEEEDMFLSVYYCWVCFDNLGLVDFVFWLVIFVLNTRRASAVFWGDSNGL